MLIPHRGLNILMSHHLHDGFEIAGSRGDHRSEVMPPAIENKLLREAGVLPTFRKMLCDRIQVRKLGIFPSRRGTLIEYT